MHDIWYVSRDTWNMTYDTGHVVGDELSLKMSGPMTYDTGHIVGGEHSLMSGPMQIHTS